MLTTSDTIVAISTPPPQSGSSGTDRAVIRLSGKEAIGTADTVFTPKLNKTSGWRRVSGEISLNEKFSISAAAYLMRSPKSYTREDIVELHVSAPLPILNKIVDKLTSTGARTANPGEFTRRALLNGRITPSEAEAVGNLLQAESAAEARSAAALLVSNAHTKREKLHEQLKELLAKLELGLDFSLEDVELLPRAELQEELKKLKNKATDILKKSEGNGSLESKEIESQFPRATLIGNPNAGKSSLFNALLGREAAIVNKERHTTRDTVETVWADKEQQGGDVLLIDTAGLGPTDAETINSPGSDLVESSHEITKRIISQADLLLLCFAGDEESEENHWLNAALAKAKPAAAAIITTKTDLTKNKSENKISEKFKRKLSKHFPNIVTREIMVSAKTGEGLNNLQSWLSEQSKQWSDALRAVRSSVGAAERAAVTEAQTAIERAQEAADGKLGEDIVAGELRVASNALEAASGNWLPPGAWTERLLDRIFSSFCIGK